jgi:hypothetical protein
VFSKKKKKTCFHKMTDLNFFLSHMFEDVCCPPKMFCTNSSKLLFLLCFFLKQTLSKSFTKLKNFAGNETFKFIHQRVFVTHNNARFLCTT